MRRTLPVITLAFVLGAVLMAAMPGLAANGDNMILGQKNNARTPTKLVSRGGLVLKVGIPNRSALTLEVVGNEPPMKVNSTGKVANLNADLLDGYSYNQLRGDSTWLTNDDIADNINWSDTTLNVTVPSGGGNILMSGSVTFTNTAANADWVQCYFKVDGTEVSGSRMMVYAQPGLHATCSTNGATQLAAGTYAVQFLTFGMSVPGLEPNDGTWYAIVVPG